MKEDAPSCQRGSGICDIVTKGIQESMPELPTKILNAARDVLHELAWLPEGCREVHLSL